MNHMDEDLRCDESPLSLKSDDEDSVIGEPTADDLDDLDIVWSPLFDTTNRQELEILISNMLIKEQDISLLPEVDYSRTKQDETFERDRAIVLQEAVQMEESHFLSPATTSLAISIFDRFFSKYYLDQANRWLIVLALRSAMHIACKVEDKHEPTFEELQDIPMQAITAKFPSAYGAKMEALILNTLDWRTSGINVVWFIDRLLLCIFPVCEELKLIYREALQLVRRSSLEIEFLRYRPSCVAASCIVTIVNQNQELCTAMGVPAHTVESALFQRIGCQVALKQCMKQVEDMLLNLSLLSVNMENVELAAASSGELKSSEKPDKDRYSPVSILDGPYDVPSSTRKKKKKASKSQYAYAHDIPSPPQLVPQGGTFAEPADSMVGVKRPRATVGAIDISHLVGRPSDPGPSNPR